FLHTKVYFSYIQYYLCPLLLSLSLALGVLRVLSSCEHDPLSAAFCLVLSFAAPWGRILSLIFGLYWSSSALKLNSSGNGFPFDRRASGDLNSSKYGLAKESQAGGRSWGA